MTRIRRGRRAGWIVLAVVAVLVAGCSDEGAATGPSPSRSVPPTIEATGAAEASQSAAPTPLSAVTTTGDATELARVPDEALATLHARTASAADVARAAELHQLAARALATTPDRFRRAVLGRLDPARRALVRGDVRAATLLRAMTDPAPRLPRWRIVAAPPAGELRGHYRAAERRTGVPWEYLAAIHLVETRMGRIRGTSTAGAQGPMQFLPPTWDRYGAGGDIQDPGDAIMAAGRLLRANGASEDMATALWHYNPSRSYVSAVTAYAEAMRRWPWTYRSYWHWRVLYRHVRGTYLLPEGYPRTRPVLLEPAAPAG